MRASANEMREQRRTPQGPRETRAPRHDGARRPVKSPAGDIDVMRFALIRRIETLAKTYRTCREPLCKRMKACVGPTLRCRREGKPLPELTPEQRSKALAQVRRAMLRRLRSIQGASG